MLRTNLPAPVEPLIGRDGEVAWLSERLQGGESRLVSVTGAGGSGKTRLAVDAATRVVGSFPDGVWLVELAGLSDPALVLAEIAATLHLRETRSAPLVDGLTRMLASGRRLLVLDNFEHLLPAGVHLAALLGRCPGLRILVTSRVRLGVKGEQEFPLEPLAALPAAELFIRRARAVCPTFVADDAGAVAVAGICRRLDGLPLAIELAAARSKVLPPPLLLRRLEDGLDVLGGGARDAPERQQSIRATVDWSYQLLAPGEQWLLRQLAVFPGGCGLEAGERVFSSPPGKGAFLAGVAALVDASLLRRAGPPEEPRLQMLEVVRARALEFLDQGKERAEAERRRAEYVGSLALEAEPHLIGAGQRQWLERLEREHDNIRAVLTWSQATPGEREGGLRTAAALLAFWWIRGHFAVAGDWLERALADTSLDPALRARGLLASGSMRSSER